MTCNMMRRMTQLALCVVFPAGAVGCIDARLSPQAQQHLRAAQQAYEAGENTRVVTEADQVLRESTGESALQAYYLRGMARYRMKQYEPAERDLAEVARRSDENSLRVRAMDALGELAYLQGEMTRSAGFLKDVLRQTPPGEKPGDHAHFRLGCIRQRQGRWEEADLHFHKLMYQFSDSSLAESARQRVGARKWTIQVGAYEEHETAQQQIPRYQIHNMPTPRIEPVLRDGRLVFLLQVGRWDEFSPAAESLGSVRTLEPEAFVTVTR